MHQSLITDYRLPSLLDGPVQGPVTPCPLFPPRLPPIPIFHPFSTLLWKNTSVRLSKTWPSTRSFPGFNLVIPPNLSSPSFESNPPTPIDPRIAKMVSRNGSPRP